MPPASFKRACGLILGYQNFGFSNEKQIQGGYNHASGKFHGLAKFLSITGNQDFGNYNLVLMSYEEGYANKISVFDDNFVEVLFAGTPLSPGL